jgi:putative SOS response-associated peptidase YedK
MCGRYRLSRRKELIAEYFDIDGDVEWEPRYNVAPTQNVGIIRQAGPKPERHLALARWGLIPAWAKDATIGQRAFNARSETVASKPAFKEAFRRQRCLIPADGFYEWRRGAAGKQPLHFGMSDDSLLAFAGLWDCWRGPGGDVVESCTILTTTPNSLLADVHDRMPVILDRQHYDRWLDPGLQNVKELAGMLKPFDAASMKRYPVSTRVNSVANDDPQCAEIAVTDHGDTKNAQLWLASVDIS